MKAGRGLRTLLMKYTRATWIKFVVVGLINTGTTYLIYVALLMFFNYQITYLISYISGIFISYILNTYFVFKTNFSWKSLLSFPLVYVVQYIVGSVVVGLIVELDLVSKVIAPIIATIILIPVTFIFSKWILKR
jgi:putative flippase GtrA